MKFSIFDPILRFFNFVIWLFHDAIRKRWKKFLIIISASFIGTFTTAVAFALLISYAKYNIDGHVISVKGFNLPVIKGVEGVLFYGFASLVLGLMSASFTFWAQKEILNLSRDYHRDIMARAIAAYNKMNFLVENANTKFFTSKHDRRHIPTIYANYVSISLKTILDSIQPLIMLFTSVFFLFYINF